MRRVTAVCLVLAGLIAAVVLSTAVQSASAARLSVSDRQIAAVWNTFEIRGTHSNIDCHVTLEGSLHSSTFAKVRGALSAMSLEPRRGAAATAA